MRARLHPVVCVLVFGLAASERDPSGPVTNAKDVKPNLRVDLDEETHFRCYVVSSQTPEPATTVTLDDQFQEPPGDPQHPSLEFGRRMVRDLLARGFRP